MTKPGPAEFLNSVPAAPGGNTPFAVRYSRELRSVAVRYAARAPRTLQEHLGPSELGYECDRQVVAKMARVPKTNNVTDPWASIVGTAIHAWLADAFTWDNDEIGTIRWVAEQRVTPDPGPDEHPGTADLYDAFELALVDHKGLALDTEIPTPSGWTTMKDVRQGDQVLGADGKACKVTRIYPIQYRNCYRVSFKGDLSVIADDVQQWEVFRNRAGGYSTRNQERVLLSTQELQAQLYAKSGQRHLRIRTAAADFPEAVLPVHPYVLGVWLGDGELHGGQVGQGREDASEIFSAIRGCGYKVGDLLSVRDDGFEKRTVFGLLKQLQTAGCVTKVSDSSYVKGSYYVGRKVIPDVYLRGSRNQRLELLRGLMDSDGSHNRVRNQSVFTTTEKTLAYQVEELAASLGWKSYTCSFTAHGFGITTTAYQVMFTSVEDNPFRLSRKAILVQDKQIKGSAYRIVQSVEPTLSVPTKCIDVDSPDHMYLATKQFIPVHNCQAESVRSKLRFSGPPIHYLLQLLLYAQGYRNMGFPVKRVVLASWPRTKSTLDDLFCWEREYTPEDDRLVADLLRRTSVRQALAREVKAGKMSYMQVPATPSDAACCWCPIYRPQAAYGGGHGCPGTLLLKRADGV